MRRLSRRASATAAASFPMKRLYPSSIVVIRDCAYQTQPPTIRLINAMTAASLGRTFMFDNRSTVFWPRSKSMTHG